MEIPGVYTTSQTTAGYSGDANYFVPKPSTYPFITSCTIGTVGVVANGFVLVVLMGYARIKFNPSTILLINQTVTDALCSMFVLLTKVLPVLELGYLTGAWGEFLCRSLLNQNLFWACFNASSFSLVSITLERYLAVVHPVFHRNHLTKRLVVGLVVLGWLLGVLCVTPVFSFFRLNNGVCVAGWPSRLFDLLYIICLTTLTYILPAVFIIVGYGKMIWVLKKRGMTVNSHTSGGAVSRETMLKGQLNTTVTMIMIAVVFVICLTPYQLYTLVTVITEAHVTNFHSDFYLFLLLGSVLNCCINPFIYAIKYNAFKNGTRRMFRLKSANRVTSTDTDPNTE